MEYDIVVVGAGTAGIPCAVAAASAGARVLLLEKAADVGGTLHVSVAHLSGGGTRRQAARGIADSPAAHADDVLRISGGTVRRDLLDLAVRLAPETIDWLEDEGIAWAPECPRVVYGHEPYGTPRTVYAEDGGLAVLAVLRRLLDEAIADGSVELRLASRVSALLTGPGVRLDDGAEIAAPAVVLATGGIAAAPGLFEELEGVPLFSAAWPTSTGDGLRMARAAGAAVAGRGAYIPTFGGLPAEEPGGRIAFTPRPLLVAAERPPWEIYVDRHGRRFAAEDEPSVDRKERLLMERVPDLTFWTVFDSRALVESHPVVLGWTPGELRGHAGRRAGVHGAPDLAGLADAAGIDPAGLAATVERYNGFVAAGADPDHGRSHLPAPITEPPFYALRNHGVTLIGFSGVDVDSELRVRRPDGSVIGGLYAAGEVLGAAATSGHAFCGGMLVTPALSFGRFLGARLAGRET